MKLNSPVVQHSADVRLSLHVNAETLDLAQLGRDFIILDTPQDIPAQEAEIVMSVDGYETRWPVFLPDGISQESGMIQTARVPAVH